MDKKKIAAATLAFAGLFAGFEKYKSDKKLKEPYSRLDEIPNGRASDIVTPGCIVIEGGALRGMYAGGALDALMKNDLNLETTIGVSAGAMFGYLYVAGQIGRGARFNLENRYNPEYVGVGAMLESGSPFGFKYAFDNDNTPEDPIDFERFNNSPRHFVAVATDCETGKPAYLTKENCSDILEGVHASATLPAVSRMTELDGKKYLDGGCSVAVPVDWAIEQGFEKIIVVRTRERTYRKLDHDSKTDLLIKQEYRAYPELLDSMLTADERYNKLCEHLISLEKEGRIYTIAPSISPTVGRIEKDLEKIGDLYWLGYNDTLDQLDQLKKYLEA
ncbi:MAG: patatin family protein [Eubacterium sp.]|nr:patatin family protein [Eubacterium sp.]